MITVPVTFWVIVGASSIGNNQPPGKAISGRIARDRIRILNPDAGQLDGPPPGPLEVYQSRSIWLGSQNNSGQYDILNQAQLDQIVVDPPNIDIQYPTPGQTIQGTISYPDTEDWYGLEEIDVYFATGGAVWMARVFGVGGVLEVSRSGRTYNFKTITASTSGTTGDNYLTRAPITQVDIEMNGELIGSGFEQSHFFLGFEAAKPVRIRMVDARGASTKWRTVYMPPVPVFDLIDTANPVFKVNALQSFSPTSRITEYRWGGYLMDGIFDVGTVPPSGIKNDGFAVAEIDFSAIPVSALDEMLGYISLVVFDATGFTELDGHPIVYPQTGRVNPTGLYSPGRNPVKVKPAANFTATQSPHGEVFSARYDRQGTTPGIRTERTVTNIDHNTQLSFTPLCAKATLFHNSSGQMFMSAAQLYGQGSKYAGSYWLFWQTLDCGDTFRHIMEFSPFTYAQYSKAVPCHGTTDGIFAMAALKAGTSDVYVAVYNGRTWNTPKLALTLPPDSIQDFAFFQESTSASSRFRICSPAVDYCSNDTCETWEQTP